jgi:hypothetical protein
LEAQLRLQALDRPLAQALALLAPKVQIVRVDPLVTIPQAMPQAALLQLALLVVIPPAPRAATQLGLQAAIQQVPQAGLQVETQAQVAPRCQLADSLLLRPLLL